MKKIFAISGTLNYLIVVFLNAFTDLGHKIIIQNTVFKVYDGTTQIMLSAIVNALVLLPFLLVFSPAGFLSDKFAKNIIMKYSAALAVLITLLITYSYYNGWFLSAFALTFVLSLQSAIYAPAKYGYIKELVGERFISAGNAAVQALTTAAILLGIIFYTALFELLFKDDFSTKGDILQSIAPLGWLLVFGSVIELIAASKLPNKMIQACKREFELAKYIKGLYLRKNIILIRRKREIFDSIIALSLFWSISQVVLAVFGEYAKSTLGITNTVIVQGIMALAVLGIVFGSVLAANFSKYYINIGLSAFGAFGIMVLLFFIPNTTSIFLLGVEFIFFGLFSGMLIVPLNSQIQYLSPNIHLGTILAGNNFVQTLFMFFFLLISTVFAYLGADSTVLFYIMCLVASYLVVILFKRYFDMSVWAVLELLFNMRYRFNYIGIENIPKNRAVMLVGNHVSWIDWFVLQLPIKTRINYMIDKDIYNWKIFNFFFKKAGLIPISKKASKDSFVQASKRLKDGKIIAIFPEGEISKSSDVSKFYRGYQFIDIDGAVIVPFFIDGIFGSLFSRHKGQTKRCFLKKREISVYFGEPISEHIQAGKLREKVIDLKRM